MLGIARFAFVTLLTTSGWACDELQLVSYNCAIEENMMDYAKECKFAHNSYKDRHGCRQNLHMTSGRNVSKTRAAENSVSAWFSELEHKGVPKENRLTMEVFNDGVGHYSQVVWQWSKKVGCAVVWCKDMNLVGCEYARAGNYLGSLIYEIGEPCKEDKDCNCDTNANATEKKHSAFRHSNKIINLHEAVDCHFRKNNNNY